MKDTAQCIVHKLEYKVDTQHYIETWVCANCPYQESRFIECL